MPSVPKTQSFSILCAYSAAGVFWGAFAAATPAIKAISGLDAAGFGLLLLAMTSGAIPAMIIFGWVADRIARWALPCCLTAFALAALALSQASDLTGLVLALFLVGAASGALDIALNLRVSTIERSNLTRLFNRAHAMFPLSILVVSPVVGLARDGGIGTDTVFASVSAALIAAAILEAAVGKTLQPAGKSETSDPAARFRVSGVLLLMGAIAALGAFQEMAVQSWSAIFVESALLASASIGGLAPAAFTLGLSAGRFAAHAMERRLEATRLTMLASGIGVLAFLVVATSPNPLLALVGFALAGIAVGPLEPTVYRLVTERAAEGHRGTMLSAVTTVAYVGYLSSPPLLGAIAETSGWSALWLITAGFAASVIALLTILRRRLP